MLAQVIDNGIATAGLLAQVMVAKYADHFPQYRQKTIFERAGMALPRSTLGACGVRLSPLVDALQEAMLAHRVLHADDAPVAMLKPGTDKTHLAYLPYTPGAFEGMKAVVYDFADSKPANAATTSMARPPLMMPIRSWSLQRQATALNGAFIGGMCIWSGSVG